MKPTHRHLLQLYYIKETTESTWEHLETWMTALLPHFPRNKMKYAVESVVQKALKCKPDERLTFYQSVVDLDSIGKILLFQMLACLGTH